jgi:hypothetical protein
MALALFCLFFIKKLYLGQALDVFHYMMIFFIWTKKCLLHLKSRYSVHKFFKHLWTTIIEIRMVTLFAIKKKLFF